MRGRWFWLLGSAFLLVSGCGAPDAGTYCEQDYHCISGSCTWRSCDAFPSCWPSCGDEEEDPVESTPPPSDWRRPSLDAGVCELRLCSELTPAECGAEPGCRRIDPCSPDARTLDFFSDLFVDAGSSVLCGLAERCASWSTPDLRVHPLYARGCF